MSHGQQKLFGNLLNSKQQSCPDSECNITVQARYLTGGAASNAKSQMPDWEGSHQDVCLKGRIGHNPCQYQA